MDQMAHLLGLDEKLLGGVRSCLGGQPPCAPDCRLTPLGGVGHERVRACTVCDESSLLNKALPFVKTGKYLTIVLVHNEVTDRFVDHMTTSVKAASSAVLNVPSPTRLRPRWV